MIIIRSKVELMASPVASFHVISVGKRGAHLMVLSVL